MKKLFAFLILTVALFSCYDDYVVDFDYNGVYFTNLIDVRTLVVGEGMKIEIGAVLSGVMKNTKDRNVFFSIEDTLVTPQILLAMKGGANYIKNSVTNTLLPLPTDYYTLSDYEKIVIKSGEHSGAIVLKADSANFLADAATIMANYAIPLYITSCDESIDTILESKRYTVIGIKYENMLFGNYWHGGVTTIKDPGGTPVDTLIYPTAIPSPENNIWKLTTVAPNTLITNGYSNITTTKGEMRLTLDGNNIIVSSNTGSTFIVEPEGTSAFNRSKLLQDRRIYLNYKYINAAGNTCYAQDTLTFRNRIRDGINEWQDENASHYTK